MPLTPDDLCVLALIARYYVLTREQIQQLQFPDHASGRATRRRLSRLRNAGFITKHNVQVTLPHSKGTAPVYFATKQGAELLASWYDNAEWLATNTRTPRADRLSHWIAINDTRIVIEQAIDRQKYVALESWVTEWEVINKSAVNEEQFALHTVLRETPPLSCSPDAGFLLRIGEHRKVFYIERDLGTSSPKQIAARKTKGYAELAKIHGHFKHFPETNINTFNVLFVTTSDYRRSATREHIERRPSPQLWLYANQKSITAESFLHEKVFQNHAGKPVSLVPNPRSAGENQ